MLIPHRDGLVKYSLMLFIRKSQFYLVITVIIISLYNKLIMSIVKKKEKSKLGCVPFIVDPNSEMNIICKAYTHTHI